MRAPGRLLLVVAHPPGEVVRHAGSPGRTR
jgi:hypothetical protein